MEDLLVEDLPDGDVRMGGSFKTAISRLATSEYLSLDMNDDMSIIFFVISWFRDVCQLLLTLGFIAQLEENLQPCLLSRPGSKFVLKGIFLLIINVFTWS